MKLTLASRRVHIHMKRGKSPMFREPALGGTYPHMEKGGRHVLRSMSGLSRIITAVRMSCGIRNSELGVGVSEESAYDLFRLDIFGFRARLTSANSGFTSSRLPALNQRRYCTVRYCTVIEYSHYYC